MTLVIKHAIHHNTATPPSLFRELLQHLLLLCTIMTRAGEARRQTISDIIKVDVGAAGSCSRLCRRPRAADTAKHC